MARPEAAKVTVVTTLASHLGASGAPRWWAWPRCIHTPSHHSNTNKRNSSSAPSERPLPVPHFTAGPSALTCRVSREAGAGGGTCWPSGSPPPSPASASAGPGTSPEPRSCSGSRAEEANEVPTQPTRSPEATPDPQNPPDTPVLRGTHPPSSFLSSLGQRQGGATRLTGRRAENNNKKHQAARPPST